VIDFSDYRSEMDAWCRARAQKPDDFDLNRFLLDLERAGATQLEKQQALDVLGYTLPELPVNYIDELEYCKNAMVKDYIGPRYSFGNEMVRSFRLYWQDRYVNGKAWQHKEEWNRYTAGSAKSAAIRLCDSFVTTAKFDHNIDVKIEMVSFELQIGRSQYRCKNLSGFVIYKHRTTDLVYVWTPQNTLDPQTLLDVAQYNVIRIDKPRIYK